MKYRLKRDTPENKAGTVFNKRIVSIDSEDGDSSFYLSNISDFDSWFEPIEENQPKSIPVVFPNLCKECNKVICSPQEEAEELLELVEEVIKVTWQIDGGEVADPEVVEELQDRLSVIAVRIKEQNEDSYSV